VKSEPVVWDANCLPRAASAKLLSENGDLNIISKTEFDSLCFKRLLIKYFLHRILLVVVIQSFGTYCFLMAVS